jgi:hypothetical protein
LERHCIAPCQSSNCPGAVVIILPTPGPVTRSE